MLLAWAMNSNAANFSTTSSRTSKDKRENSFKSCGGTLYYACVLTALILFISSSGRNPCSWNSAEEEADHSLLLEAVGSQPKCSM